MPSKGAHWERFRSLLAPDAVYAETGTGQRVEGADAYVELCQGWKEALPDVRGTIRGAVAGDDTVAQELLWDGTHTGPMQTPGGTSRHPERRSASRRPCGPGPRVTRLARSTTTSTLTLLQQIGAIPAQSA
jgi:hypothetical protein